MIFVDTNYFLRFLLKDTDDQHQTARELFDKAADGEVELFTSMIVFFEIYWTLHSFYGKNKTELTNLLSEILKMSFIKFQEYQLLKEAVKISPDLNYDLEDAFNLVYAGREKANKFSTFDKRLNKKFISTLK